MPEVLCLFIGLVAVAVISSIVLVAGYENRHAIVRRMSLEEEARAEIDTEITAKNVQAVINDTIETGIEHPLLTARKRGN